VRWRRRQKGTTVRVPAYAIRQLGLSDQQFR
jgi:hypothetical protein